jgi:hypothetical protein
MSAALELTSVFSRPGWATAIFGFIGFVRAVVFFLAWSRSGDGQMKSQVLAIFSHLRIQLIVTMVGKTGFLRFAVCACALKKAKRKFWNTQFVLPTLSKINQKQNKIDISI